MIILESDWNQAAGLEVEHRENEDNSTLPRYVDVEPEQTHSRTSIGTSSRSSRNRSSALLEPPPSASSTNGTTTSERLPKYARRKLYCGPLNSDRTPLSSYRDSSDSARTSPVTYIFSYAEHAYNSMSLQTQTASIPLYHIAVRLNVFIPTSYITIISRGDAHGELVGQFEMGLSVRKGTVTIDGRERLIDAVLTKGGSRLTRTWQWRFDGDPKKQLTWMFEGPAKQCFQGNKSSSGDGTLLAVYTPPPLTPLPNARPAPAASLKVFPEGQRAFDHILISALILERRRLSPNT
ncbi:hypothetical protein EIP86_002739 [Pleurotus ostreatoroseus]|nr:hypothetical protein EIP86_002739 [Pleurotus ostreatoroseus]